MLNWEFVFWKTEFVLSKIGVWFLKIGVYFCDNRSLLFWKSEFVFLKIGVCFFWKSEFDFLKIGVCFFENRSLLFWKSEFVPLKMGVCFFENRGLIFGNRSFFYENPSIGHRFCSVPLLLSWNKISGGSRGGGGRGTGPPHILRPNWGLRPRDRPPPPYLKVWKIYLSLQNFAYVLVKHLMINLDKHLTLSLHESSDLPGWQPGQKTRWKTGWQPGQKTQKAPIKH